MNIRECMLLITVCACSYIDAAKTDKYVSQLNNLDLPIQEHSRAIYTLRFEIERIKQNDSIDSNSHAIQGLAKQIQYHERCIQKITEEQQDVRLDLYAAIEGHE